MKTKVVFNPEQFTPTEFSTAEDKAKFANHYVRFVESGFKESLFPKWFYTRLRTCFGHIAQYNIHGFYDYWFSNTDKQVAFLEYAMSQTIYGQPTYTFSDVEKVLQDWLREKLAV